MGVGYGGTGRALQTVSNLLDIGATRRERNLDRFGEVAFLHFIQINKFK
jgi:hypothetical protein